MGSSTSRTGEGIVGRHAYSIIDVREISDVVIGMQTQITSFLSSSSSTSSSTLRYEDNSQYVSENGTVRLLRIRNPWGHHEFQGGFSSNSALWTTKLKTILDNGKQNDGTFWYTLLLLIILLILLLILLLPGYLSRTF